MNAPEAQGQPPNSPKGIRKLVVLVLGAVTAVLIAVDVWAAVTDAKGDTISEIALLTSQRWLALPFAFGALTGHIFWPGNELPLPAYWVSFAGLASLCALMVCMPDATRSLLRTPILALLLGLLLGRLMWPQKG